MALNYESDDVFDDVYEDVDGGLQDPVDDQAAENLALRERIADLDAQLV